MAGAFSNPEFIGLDDYKPPVGREGAVAIKAGVGNYVRFEVATAQTH